MTTALSYIADLHVHSRHSRATSPQCNLESLHYWAQLKGVAVVGTGDCTHPGWLSELQDKLVSADNGLYRLRPELAAPVDRRVPALCRADVQFMISGEISSIYKRDGAVRKIHSLILMPSLAAARELSRQLARRGNVHSDGRPILGLDPRDLLHIMLEIDPAAVLVPAHVWTPWFALLGSKSGFDSLEQCFGDLTTQVFAVETGLSSDPPMNWRVASLDGLRLISNSDLHSPKNLGRNANLFGGTPAYDAIMAALRERHGRAFGGTIEMFPEQGKYHADGHRKCEVRMTPEESLAADNLCPACGKPLTLGVLHRVHELAARPSGFRLPAAPPAHYIIPLPEVVGELLQRGSASQAVERAVWQLLENYGPELSILLKRPLGDFAGLELPGLRLLSEALRRLRQCEVIREAGYDGEYGTVRLFADGELPELARRRLIASADRLRQRVAGVDASSPP